MNLHGKMGNVERRPDWHYLLAEILPPLVTFISGIMVLITVLTIRITGYYENTCGNFIMGSANFLVRLLYGGETLVKESSEEEENRLTIHGLQITVSGTIDDKRNRRKLVHCMLLANTILVATLLLMVFFDLFFVQSDIDCLADRDCYIADHNYYETPVQNCTVFINSRAVKTICYTFKLSFLEAFGDTGGVLLLGTIMIVLATRFIIGFSQYLQKRENRSTGIRRKCLPFLQYLPQIAVAITVSSISVAIIVVIHLTRLQNLTIFRKFGYAFKYTTVLATFLLTVLTPWQLLNNNSSRGSNPNT